MTDSSSNSSPTRMPNEVPPFYDPTYTAEISQRMRVPKRIKVDGDADEPLLNGPNYDPPWASGERLNMRVPERIIVLDEHTDALYNGNNEHYGTRSFSPPEMVLESSVHPPDPAAIRIQTPPRVITLDKHNYPAADEYLPPPYMIESRSKCAPRPASINNNMEVDLPHNLSSRDLLNMSESNNIGAMTTSEEVVHLRKQLAKLNRRVMSIELECMQRQQRDKIMYAIGLAYIFIKTMVWLSRTN